MPVGGGTATDGHALVLFATDDLQPYKWGEGSASGTSFSVDVTDPVPAEALLIGSGETSFVGLGQVYLVPSGVDFPDGVISSDANLNDQIIGIAGNYAIIYRPSDEPFTDADWVNAFPPGLSCGVCAPGTDAEIFVPTSCDDMVLQVGPQSALDVCQWLPN